MKWINNRFDHMEVWRKAHDLSDIANQMQYYEDRLLDGVILEQTQEQIEYKFQKELSELVDLHYVAKNFVSELLDEIGEIDPDAIIDYALKIEQEER